MGAPQISPIGKRATLEEALHLYNGGDVEVAKGLFEVIVDAEPLNVDALVALGHCHWRLSELDKAQEILEKALAIQPTNITGLKALGLTMYTLGQLDRAKEVLSQCVSLAPDSHQAWLTLGLVEQRQDNLDKAELAFRKALELSPNYAEAMNNLGTVYLTQRNYSAARDLFLRAIHERPNLVDAYRSLSKLLRELGSEQEALIILRRALRIDPKDANGWNDLGGLYRDLMDTPQSIAAYRRAIEIDPKHIDAKGNLSCILANDGDFNGAKDLCTEILGMNPDMMGVRVRKAIIMPAIMDTIESIEESRQVLHQELDELPNYKGTVEDPLGQIGSTNFYLAYHGLNDRDLQRKQAEKFLAVTPSLHFEARHIGRKRRGGKIRLGICSRHLAFHTIGILWSEMFAGLDRDTFEISLFHTQPVVNRMSKNLVARIDHEVRLPLDLAKSQKLIADHELDILYYPDLGMEPLTYFLAFSRLAPTQCVSWGHPLTTGISTIDYFVSAKELEIPTAQDHYTEELVKLDTLNTYYIRPEVHTTLSRASLGVKDTATLYMCPQTLFKFHPDFDQIINDILEGDPNGELVLLEGTCANHTTLIRQRFQRTIPRVLDRIKIIPRLSHDGFLALVKMADVMLDPTHFGGGSTTIQALSFGTPVVTLPSDFLRCRISYACYRHMGVDTLIAKDPSEYARIAVELGRSEELRRTLRTELSQKSEVLFANRKVITECSEFLEGAFKKRG